MERVGSATRDILLQTYLEAKSKQARQSLQRRKNAVAQFLRGRVYKFVSKSIGVGLTATPDADASLGEKCATANKVQLYEGLLLDLTPLMLLARTDDTLYDQHRVTIQDGFDPLGSAARMRYRKSVVAHILVPHPPFVFGSNGE